MDPVVERVLYYLAVATVAGFFCGSFAIALFFVMRTMR
jgi:hypothetical protein